MKFVIDCATVHWNMVNGQRKNLINVRPTFTLKDPQTDRSVKIKPLIPLLLFT